ncbi:MAG TPA: hypothetical protein VGH11_18615 [Jatrophihabitans sp.]|jgi:hypothetical protein
MEPKQASGNADLQAARERRLSLRAAMRGLEAALAAPAYGRYPDWIPRVRASLVNLKDCMRDHVAATEGPSGFHREIVTSAPRLVHEVEVSVREHVLIIELIGELLITSDSPTTADEVEATRESGTRLLGMLARHRQRGADMIFEAYEADLGGED